MLPVWPRLSGITPLSGGINIQPSWKDSTAETDDHNATQCIPTMQCKEPGVGWIRHTCVFHSLRASEQPEPRRRIVTSIWWCRIEIWVAAGCHSRAGLCVRFSVGRASSESPLREKHMGGPRAQISSGMRPIGCSAHRHSSVRETPLWFHSAAFSLFLSSPHRVKKDKRAISPLFIRSEAAPEEARFQILGTAVF